MLLIDEPPPSARVLNSNQFFATAIPSNGFAFSSVTVAFPGPNATRVLRITGVQVNASGVAIPSDGSAPQIQMVVVISGSTLVSIPTSAIAVAIVSPTSQINIAGTIQTTSGQRLPGVVVPFSNGPTVTTDTSGHYSALVTSPYFGTAIPSLANCSFSPNTRSYTNISADLASEDYIATAASNTISVIGGPLTFLYQTGGPIPSSQTVTIASIGNSIGFGVSGTTNSGGNWLQLNLLSGAIPATLSVSVAPVGLSAGTYLGTISISATGVSNSPQAVAVTLTVVNGSVSPSVSAVANAASYATGAISPGENIVIFGQGVGPPNVTTGRPNSSGSWDTIVGNTRVLFDGVPAPVLYAFTAQTSVMAPYAISGRSTTTIRVEYQGLQSSPTTYNVVTVVPAIYTLNQSGKGPGAILNSDGTVNLPNDSALRNSYVTVYMTGEGQTTPAGVDGTVTPGNPSGWKKPQLPVTAAVGGVPATVYYAGSAPGIIAGVMQVNVQIPQSAPTGGSVPMLIYVGNSSTQANVTVAVR
jgi:uncharacterized protein (TIGR03437 family)